MSNKLLPLPEVASILGLKPASLRNALWRSRQGLPGRPVPPVVKVGARTYVEVTDLDAFLEMQKADNGDRDHDPARVIEEVAGQVEKMFPECADRLRKLARGRALKVVKNAL